MKPTTIERSRSDSESSTTAGSAVAAISAVCSTEPDVPCARRSTIGTSASAAPAVAQRGKPVVRASKSRSRTGVSRATRPTVNSAPSTSRASVTAKTFWTTRSAPKPQAASARPAPWSWRWPSILRELRRMPASTARWTMNGTVLPSQRMSAAQPGALTSSAQQDSPSSRCIGSAPGRVTSTARCSGVSSVRGRPDAMSQTCSAPYQLRAESTSEPPNSPSVAPRRCSPMPCTKSTAQS